MSLETNKKATRLQLERKCAWREWASFCSQ